VSSDEYKQSVAEFFNLRQDYNKDDFHKRFADRLVVIAKPRPGEDVLDVATGTGLVAVPVARLVGEGGKVVGVDLSAGMLGHAARSVAAEKLENVELFLTDAESLKHPPESYDLVTCGSALPYMSDIPAALRLWHGLLRPGGRLAFNGWSEDSFVNRSIVKRVAARHGVRLPMGELTGTPGRCEAILLEAGFVEPVVIVEPDGRFVPREQVERDWEKTLNHPMTHPLRSADAQTIARVRADFVEEARRLATDRGVWDEMTAYFVTARKP
jgi:ubiquinone/menaquinone biosynthesis C-methylase UbiE